jgi:hypothetical protein
MRATGLIVIFFWLLPWQASLAEPRRRLAPPEVPLATSQHVLQWLNGYRSNPRPDALPEAVRAMSRLGVFRDLEAAGVYIGFMAGVLSDNPDKAGHLVAGMFPMPPEDQVAIVRAIVYSGLPDWKVRLTSVAERMPARTVLIRRHLDDKLPTLDKLPLAGNPQAIDTLWGFYFATGRFTPVDRIVDTLPWARNRDDAEKLTAGSMAKWTLANNALQDKALLDHLQAEAARRPKAIRDELAEVVEAAATFETAKIRKEATAAIEELRRKGPESARKLTFWGQAGQTALAFGCVVAGALGHPEIAVPCVIGGAASSAALRFFTPQ